MRRAGFASLILLLVVGLALSACSTVIDLLTDETATPTLELTEEEPGEATPRPTTERPQATPTPQAQFTPAKIDNDEGGPVVITGEVTYTNLFFTAGVAEPLVILEDQAGFIDRDEGFLMPPESQTIGQITSDFFTSPFTYSLALPIEPQGTLRDVDGDDEEDTGVMVFAVAYWTNTFGDPFLERRDLYGGGWSTAYASTRVSEEAATEREIIGGMFVVYAPDDGQGFPSGFGDDGLLFTGDEPMVSLPRGYTVVNMEAEPFTFDRSREPVVDLIEPEGAALNDFSGMSYTEAFDAMLDLFRREYAYTELKGIDWDEKAAELRPRFEEAEASGDSQAYHLALRDFIWSIPDGHLGMPFTDPLADRFFAETDGGLGLSIAELDDGRVIVHYLLPDGPAEQAGIRLRAEIIAINDQPIAEAIAAIRPWSLPFSIEQNLRLQQLRYVIRFPVDTAVKLSYRNPGGGQATATLTTIAERDSFNVSSFAIGQEGDELPLEFELRDDGYVYVKIYSFFDNAVLTIQLWERMIQMLNENNVPGLIIDMRQNGGGSGFLADQMAAYFFDEELQLGLVSTYDESIGDFFVDERDASYFYPPPEDLRYHGPVAVLVGPNCSSACEYFAYDMTQQERATIVGHYSTGGLGGGQEAFVMPEGLVLQISIARHLDTEGNIIIEGAGVAPDVRVPVTEETLFSEGDPVLEAAVNALGQPRGAGITPEGPPAVDTTADLIDLLQRGVEVLDDLAQEQYTDEERQQPGTFVYTVPLASGDPEVLWLGAWCTSTPEGLDDNLTKITWSFSLDGEIIPVDEMGYFEDRGVVLQTPCAIHYALLSDWPAGEHVLVTTMAFSAPLSDGFADYPAGEYISEYHVYVGR